MEMFKNPRLFFPVEAEAEALLHRLFNSNTVHWKLLNVKTYLHLPPVIKDDVHLNQHLASVHMDQSHTGKKKKYNSHNSSNYNCDICREKGVINCWRLLTLVWLLKERFADAWIKTFPDVFWGLCRRLESLFFFHYETSGGVLSFYL